MARTAREVRGDGQGGARRAGLDPRDARHLRREELLVAARRRTHRRTARRVLAVL
ncbi:hypothetical protein [Vallicoccus soli]|uniref:hypothetical protein n=1 Tax=Vallicoccus soli TaxID=2339232 RepID=UPI001403E70A|nr:hypothetical protein [Vallicoccus soli]